LRKENYSESIGGGDFRHGDSYVPGGDIEKGEKNDMINFKAF